MRSKKPGRLARRLAAPPKERGTRAALSRREVKKRETEASTGSGVSSSAPPESLVRRAEQLATEYRDVRWLSPDDPGLPTLSQVTFSNHAHVRISERDSLHNSQLLKALGATARARVAFEGIYLKDDEQRVVIVIVTENAYCIFAGVKCITLVADKCALLSVFSTALELKSLNRQKRVLQGTRAEPIIAAYEAGLSWRIDKVLRNFDAENKAPRYALRVAERLDDGDDSDIESGDSQCISHCATEVAASATC